MKLENITKRYGKKTIFDRFSLEIEEKKITCIMGKSGIGKTTLLNMIAGICPFEGKIEKSGDDIGYIFQTPNLIPTKTVFGNLEFVLKETVKDKREREQKINGILREVELLSEKDTYPSRLSGGMAQRVSLARAFCVSADILLMDEPFKGLDISLKKKITELFLKLYNQTPKTTVLVSHDTDEVLLLADTVAILSAGEKYVFSLDKTREERTLSDFPDIRREIYRLL